MKRLLVIFAMYYYNAFADTVMITSNQNNIINSITRDEVRNLYLMKTRRLDDGQAVVLFQMPNSSIAHKRFIRDILNLSPNQYNRELDRLTNTGLGTSIRVVNTKQEMLSKVSITYNSVGYIDNDTLIIYSGENYVKTFKITE